MALNNDFKIKNGLTVTDSISAGGNLSAVDGFFDGNVGIGTNSMTSTEKLVVDGTNGNLFSVTDAVTGVVFSVNDAAGLPILEVESTDLHDTVTIGEYSTNAIVVSGACVGLGGATNSYTLDVTGDINASTNILSGGTDLADIFATSAGNVDGSGTACTITVWEDSDTIGDSIMYADTSTVCVGGSLSASGDIYTNIVKSSTYPTYNIISLEDDNLPNQNGVTLQSVGSMAFFIDVNNNSSNDSFDWCVDGASGGSPSNIMRLTDEGNLGIGTTSPTAPLTFGKSVYGGTSSENFFRVKFKDNGGIQNDVGIGQSDVNSLDFNKSPGGIFSFNDGTNGEVMRIDSSGNIGIGKNNPSAKFEVLGGSGDTARFEDDTQVSVDFKAGSASNYIVGLTAGDLSFRPNSTALMHLDGSLGRVGIGTTSPGYKLEISDDTDSTVNLLRLRNSDTTYSQSWDFQLDTSKDLVITGASGSGGVKIVPGSRGFTVDGDINTQSDLLSGGVNLDTLFVKSTDAGVTCISSGTAITVTNCDTANPTVNVASECNTAWNCKLDSSGTIATNDYAKFNSSGDLIGRCYSEVRSDLGLEIGTDVQAYDADLTAIAGLACTNSNFIVGNGSTWVAESGSTARTSLGLGTAATLNVGIGNTCVLQADSTVSDNDFLRINGTKVEGRTASNVYCDLGLGSIATCNDGDYLPIDGRADDSALLDGIDSSQFLRSDTADTASETINFCCNICVGDQIFHTGDADTYLRFGTNAFCVYAGNEQHLLASGAGIVINEGGASNDFRVESNTNDHMLFVDGSADKVGIGCATPGQTLTVAGSALFTGDATVNGNLNVLGDFTCIETTVSLTSAMDITNHGSGPRFISQPDRKQ